MPEVSLPQSRGTNNLEESVTRTRILIAAFIAVVVAFGALSTTAMAWVETIKPVSTCEGRSFEYTNLQKKAVAINFKGVTSTSPVIVPAGETRTIAVPANAVPGSTMYIEQAWADRSPGYDKVPVTVPDFVPADQCQPPLVVQAVPTAGITCQLNADGSPGGVISANADLRAVVAPEGSTYSVTAHLEASATGLSIDKGLYNQGTPLGMQSTGSPAVWSFGFSDHVSGYARVVIDEATIVNPQGQVIWKLEAPYVSDVQQLNCVTPFTPRVDVEKTLLTKKVKAGGLVRYRVTISSDARDVRSYTLTDAFNAAKLELIKVSPSLGKSGKGGPGRVRWTYGPTKAGFYVTGVVTFRVAISARGKVCNTVIGSVAGGKSDRDTVCARIVPPAKKPPVEVPHTV